MTSISNLFINISQLLYFHRWCWKIFFYPLYERVYLDKTNELIGKLLITVCNIYSKGRQIIWLLEKPIFQRQFLKIQRLLRYSFVHLLLFWGIPLPSGRKCPVKLTRPLISVLPNFPSSLLEVKLSCVRPIQEHLQVPPVSVPAAQQ